MHSFMKDMGSCSGAKLERDVKCVVLIYKPQNGPLSADIVNEEANRILAFELGHWSAMSGMRSSVATVSESLMCILG